jgi:hypothetical protein
MAKDSNHLSDGFDNENTGGFLTGLLAEEDVFDRRSLWRLGSWAAATVGAVVVALLANQSSIGWRRDQLAAADLARQSQQIQFVARESQNETRRLASAIDNLNGERDRLVSRLAVLEKGLDSVTGAIARQSSSAPAPQAAASTPAEAQAAPQNPVAPAPVVAAPATTSVTVVEKNRPAAAVAEPAPATVASVVDPAVANKPAAPLMPAKSLMAPPDSAAAKLIEPEPPAGVVTMTPIPDAAPSVASAEQADIDQADEASPKLAVQRTEFGVDIGTANSLGGLRALWRGLVKSNSALASLHPIVAIKEGSNGLGMQLRLVAGPLSDAAAAARICAAIGGGKRTCETTVFDGQRLVMKPDDPPAVDRPAPAKPAATKRSPAPKPVVSTEKPETSTLSALFGRR